MVTAELPWGWLADRLGPRPLLVAGPLVLGAGFAVLGHVPGFLACQLAMALTGAAHAMVSGADSAYLYEVVSAEGRRPHALREEAVAHRWRLFGVSACDVAGGAVAFALGTAAAFDLSVALMLAAAVVAFRLPAVRRPAPASGTGSRPASRLARLRLAPMARALRSPGVAWVMVWYAAVFVLLRVGFQLYQPTLLAVRAEALWVHGAVLGLLNLFAGLAALLVGPVHVRWRERGSAVAVLLLLAASFAGLAAALPLGRLLLLLTPLFALQQIAFAFLQPLGRTALNHRIPAEDRTTLLSAQSMLARLLFGLVLACVRWGDSLEAELSRTYLVVAGAAVLAALLLGRTHRPAPEDVPGRP
jgi:MFS family permease